jgi:hypothetical protein
MTAAQLATLKTELQTDPRGYGYASLVALGSDEGLAQLLNVVRDGSVGTVPSTPTAAGGAASGIITVRRNDISGAEILQAVDPSSDGAASLTALQTAFFNCRRHDAQPVLRECGRQRQRRPQEPETVLHQQQRIPVQSRDHLKAIRDARRGTVRYRRVGHRRGRDGHRDPRVADGQH